MNDTMQALRRAAQCEQAVLPSGMTVLVRPMPGFRDVHAVCGTRFGSADLEFELEGRRVTLPAGTAHFLEHKMFESEEGDAFAQYAAVGASANAFTSFDKTCYVFSTTQGVDKALDILLGMVSHPYFTEATVQKEQGIIGQEIRMYDDSAEWRMMFALLECLYHRHPVRQDIAGTAATIAEITPAMLYQCTRAFYNPANLVLAVAGNVTLQEVLAAVERAGFDRTSPQARRFVPSEPDTVASPGREFTMSIAKPFLGVGYKELPPQGDALQAEILCDVLSEVIAGPMTPLYRKLYDEGLAGSDFAGEFLSVPGALCLLFSGETDQPEKVRELLLEEIERIRAEGVDEELFTLCKNQMYGELVCELDSATGVAGAISSSALKGHTLYEEMSALAELSKADVDAALRGMLKPERSATVIIRPEEEEE